jgi:DNA-binding SARP family transcriptional activator
MSIGVLGPLSHEGAAAFGRRDRAVLTALAMCVGRTVTADRLADAVWGSDPPSTAHKALQGCVVRLRKVLGAEAIETCGHGYRLVVPADEVDSRRFERMAARSRELLAMGEPDRAAELVAQALELWRGGAFEELGSWDLAAIEAGRLDELRLEAEELRVDASLRTGRHLDVLAAAESMVREAPLRERRWTLLALAQYQSGRQTEALRTIHRLKALLSDQLGLDPGPDLTSLEEAILRQDASLLAQGSRASRHVCPALDLASYADLLLRAVADGPASEPSVLVALVRDLTRLRETAEAQLVAQWETNRLLWAIAAGRSPLGVPSWPSAPEVEASAAYAGRAATRRTRRRTRTRTPGLPARLSSDERS